MTQLTTHCDPGSRTTPAPPLLGTAHRRSLPAVLTDPRVRLGAGTAVLLVTAWAARRGRISPAEITAFRAVNGLPDSIHPPAWAIMQLGTLGAAPVAAGMAREPAARYPPPRPRRCRARVPVRARWRRRRSRCRRPSAPRRGRSLPHPDRHPCRRPDQGLRGCSSPARRRRWRSAGTCRGRGDRPCHRRSPPSAGNVTPRANREPW